MHPKIGLPFFVVKNVGDFSEQQGLIERAKFGTVQNYHFFADFSFN